LQYPREFVSPAAGIHDFMPDFADFTRSNVEVGPAPLSTYLEREASSENRAHRLPAERYSARVFTRHRPRASSGSPGHWAD
jgi:hypothetical protein